MQRDCDVIQIQPGVTPIVAADLIGARFEIEKLELSRGITQHRVHDGTIISQFEARVLRRRGGLIRRGWLDHLNHDGGQRRFRVQPEDATSEAHLFLQHEVEPLAFARAQLQTRAPRSEISVFG